MKRSSADRSWAVPVPCDELDRESARGRRLLRRVARGDVGALRALYDDHAGRTMAIAVRVLKDRRDAEEVVQETFVEIWKRAGQYDPGRGGLVAWMATIARSRAIDRLRSTSSASRAVEAAAAEAPPASLRFPKDVAELRQDGARIRAALGALPSEQRATIELAYFDGLTQSEIAARTGNPLGTVKMRVRLAMAKLAVLLEDLKGDGK